LKGGSVHLISGSADTFFPEGGDDFIAVFLGISPDLIHLPIKAGPFDLTLSGYPQVRKRFDLHFSSPQRDIDGGIIKNV
jgi:hypothetical protein